MKRCVSRGLLLTSVSIRDIMHLADVTQNRMVHPSHVHNSHSPSGRCTLLYHIKDEKKANRGPRPTPEGLRPQRLNLPDPAGLIKFQWISVLFFQRSGKHLRDVTICAIFLSIKHGTTRVISKHSMYHIVGMPTHLISCMEAVTIDKGADSKENELSGWKASARNQKHLEQH
jgi:hypothetical protein